MDPSTEQGERSRSDHGEFVEPQAQGIKKSLLTLPSFRRRQGMSGDEGGAAEHSQMTASAISSGSAIHALE
jgi:hypothetical protein